MQSHDYAELRDRVFRRARELVGESPIQYEQAGQQLDALYTEQLIDADRHDEPCVKYAVQPTPEMTRFRRLVAALDDIRYSEHLRLYNHLDFLSSDTTDERLIAARMTILVMLAAADPNKSEVVTDAMGDIASIPYCIVENVDGKNELAFGGSDWIPWAEQDWEEHNEPSPRLLKHLDAAIRVAKSGSSDNPQSRKIPSGDGRPCDHPGRNKFDECDRALRDVARYVGHYHHCVVDWNREWEIRYEERARRTLEEIKIDNRIWWSKWASVLARARDAIGAIDRPELMKAKQDAFDALAYIADRYQDPLIYHEHEEPGDHLFRTAHRWRRDPEDAKRLKMLAKSLDDFDPLRRGCLLYLDDSGDAPNGIATETKRKRRSPRTKQQIQFDEIRIGNYLNDHPEALRDDVAKELQLPGATISNSKAWKMHKARRQECRKMRRPLVNTDALDDAVIDQQ